MKRVIHGLALLGLVPAALTWLAGCKPEHLALDTRVKTNGKIVREVVIKANKERADVLRAALKAPLRERGFHPVKGDDDTVVRFRCKVSLLSDRGRNLFPDANFRRRSVFLCPVARIWYEETIPVDQYLADRLSTEEAAAVDITYNVFMPGRISEDGSNAAEYQQSSKLFFTYSRATWTGTLAKPMEIKVESRARKNGTILFWLIVLGGLLYLGRGVPARYREARVARAEKRRKAREEKARKKAERDLRRAEEERRREELRRQKEEERLAKQEAKEERRRAKGAAPSADEDADEVIEELSEDESESEPAPDVQPEEEPELPELTEEEAPQGESAVVDGETAVAEDQDVPAEDLPETAEEVAEKSEEAATEGEPQPEEAAPEIDEPEVQTPALGLGYTVTQPQPEADPAAEEEDSADEDNGEGTQEESQERKGLFSRFRRKRE